MPALPRFTDGWQLGAPDLVLEMAEPFDVPAGGPDVYRNFVLAGLDIPAGEKSFTITGRLTLPADMLALSVSPHAHYLGKEFKATATLPDGSTKPMLWIQDWDFNWQDRYYYKEPVLLPKGSRIDVTITYDNSADNPRNPCKPPRRVQWGMQSSDEMGGMRFQMVPVNAEAETALQQNFAPAIGRGLVQAAQSDAAKNAAKRFAEQQQRFRDGVTATAGCEGR